MLKKRDAKNLFREVWKIDLDPADIFVDRSTPKAPAPLIEIQKSGDPAEKVDFLIIGDGYTAAEAAKFERDARRMTEVLFETSPFKERRRGLQRLGLMPARGRVGRLAPFDGRLPRLAARRDLRRLRLGALRPDVRQPRAAARGLVRALRVRRNPRQQPNLRRRRNLQPLLTVAADNAWANYVFVHEFGHHFAALADEYYTSSVAYAPAAERTEPWEPNVTALLDPAELKWKDLVSADTPLPTPWGKEAFETYSREIQKRRGQIRAERRPEEVMEALFREELEHEHAMFAKEKYAGRVGAFEGANYEAKGFYRPEVDCIMFTRTNHFCAVCRRAIERVIDMYAR